MTQRASESFGVRSLRRIGALARKELLQLVRERLTLAMVVVMPALQLVLFGYAINLDVRDLPTAVLDRARSPLSRELIGQLEATQTFRIVSSVATRKQADTLLERSEVAAVISIPPDLDSRLLRGRGAEISILADATNPTVTGAVATAAEGLATRLARRFRRISPVGAVRTPRRGRETFAPQPDLVRPAPFRIAVIPFYNPESRTPVFIVPGLVGVILTMTMMLMTALAIVRERERGTFEFLIATPVHRVEVMIGKIAPYLGVGFVQVAMILLLGRFLFHVPLHGSPLDLAAASLLFISSMLAVGVLISSAAASQFQAMQMAFFFFLPSMLLSGFAFPFDSMPLPARWLGEILPLTHFLRVVRGILLKGAPIEILWRDVAAIAAFLVVALAGATGSFRKRLA